MRMRRCVGFLLFSHQALLFLVSETTCFLDEDSSTCQSLEPTTTANLILSLDTNGSLVECDGTNVNIGLDECGILTPDLCEQSSIFPSCHFIGLTQTALFANPSVLQNTAPFNEADKDEVYLIYYEDQGCQNPVGLKGHVVTDETADNISYPILDSSVTCHNAMACILNPNGTLCQQLVNGTAGEVSNYAITAVTKNSTTLCYEQAGSEVCYTVADDECLGSNVFPTCYYKYVSAESLFEDPVLHLTGGGVVTEAPAAAPSSPASPVASSPTAASPTVASPTASSPTPGSSSGVGIGMMWASLFSVVVSLCVY